MVEMQSEKEIQIERIAYAMLKALPQELCDMVMDSCGLHGLLTLPAEEIIRISGGARRLHETLASRESLLQRAAQEYAFVCEHKIRLLSIFDESYPQLLRETSDAPRLLYVLGDADLSAERMLAIVGTRRSSAYGTAVTRKIVSELSEQCPPVSIVSGLAYGIDSAAHNAALECGMPTVAVVAHGLGMVYPAAHRELAREIVKSGGAIVSEYPHDAKPFKGNFLERNRIVAGLCPVTLVSETPLKGGAISTASIAASHDREVLAIPGRLSDACSAGCNNLIRANKASICTGTADIIEAGGWDTTKQEMAEPQGRQLNLFASLTGQERAVAECVNNAAEPLQLDQIANLTGLPMSELLSAISMLEFEGFLLRHPGNRFSPGMV